MTTTKSAHSSDDADDLDAPGKNAAGSDKTILHEVAHHFGIEHEEMPIWIQ
ncbi:hypothetical protein [Ktedonobacter robiniae]|uniref:Peptidase M10 metallopeptidase domain-containing protein n=1 Tax=Ktedonobacter robiniae TaxID=2778365 RepID=A0ABQ3V0E4_9CHLR|nr:hypothetical protein [Ktedonobacter robiniae]GHO58410.1 hypothetical protein KSB_68850 [Ktedonobacter robiniae]